MVSLSPEAFSASPVVSGVRRKLPLRGRFVERRTVWLLGSPRSGSTWLAHMVSTIPGIGLMNEPQLGMYLTPFLADLPGFDAGAVADDQFSIRHLRVFDENQFFDEHNADVWLPRIRSLINARIGRRLAAMPLRRLPRSRVLIKDPNASEGADLVMRAQTRAGLIFLYRDARDVLASEMAAQRPGAWISDLFPASRGIDEASRRGYLDLAARKWVWRTLTVRKAFDAHPGHKRFIRYEDLRADPARVLEDLLPLFGKDSSRTDVESIVARFDIRRRPRDLVGEREFVRSGQVGEHASAFSDEERELIETITAPTRNSIDAWCV